MTVQELQAHLDRLDDGILRRGSHKAGGREFCALEFKSQVDGIAWTDSPESVHMPELRPLNDAGWSSNKARTAGLLPVMAALWDWRSWSAARRERWHELVLLDTTNELIATMPFFVKNGYAPKTPLTSLAELKEWAAEAAEAARAAWAAWAAWAAEAAEAAEAARAAWAAWAARAAEAAESDRVLNRACAIWIHAAEVTEGL